MVGPRIAEADSGIDGEYDGRIYDQMQRRFRDKGWLKTRAVVASGIDRGLALELGPGPGYLGLEWLKRTKATRLCGVDISPEMVALARSNASDYELTDRVCYVEGDGQRLPFEDGSFDAVFTCNSLHEWDEAAKTMDEIHRVLKAGGRYFIGDLRRDVSLPARWFLYLVTKPGEIRPGLIRSIDAAYTVEETEAMLGETGLCEGKVRKNPIGLDIVGVVS